MGGRQMLAVANYYDDSITRSALVCSIHGVRLVCRVPKRVHAGHVDGSLLVGGRQMQPWQFLLWFHSQDQLCHLQCSAIDWIVELRRAHAGRSWMGSLLRGRAADAGRGQLSGNSTTRSTLSSTSIPRRPTRL